MGGNGAEPQPAVHDRLANDRLDSWKEIAAYLNKKFEPFSAGKRVLVCPYAAWRMESWAPSSLTSKNWMPGGRKVRASSTLKKTVLMKSQTPPDRTWGRWPPPRANQKS